MLVRCSLQFVASLVLAFTTCSISGWSSKSVAHEGHSTEGSMEKRAEIAHARLQFQSVLLTNAASLDASATKEGFFLVLASGERMELAGPFWDLLIESFQQYRACVTSHSCAEALVQSPEPLMPPIQKLKLWLSGPVRYGIHARSWDASRWSRMYGPVMAGVLIAVETLESALMKGLNNMTGLHIICVPFVALAKILSNPLSFAS